MVFSKNVLKTLERCHCEGMNAQNTVAYILIHHCAAELPRFNTRRVVTDEVEKYYRKHRKYTDNGKEDSE